MSLLPGKMVAQADPELKKRIDEVVTAFRTMNITKMVDMTYPGVFDLASREELEESLNAAFFSDQFQSKMDSVTVEKIHPVFKHGKGEYTMVRLSMLLNMKFIQPLDSNSDKLKEELEGNFGKGNVGIDAKNNKIIIRLISRMAGIKDNTSPEWTFLTWEDGSANNELILSKELVEKLTPLK